MAPVQWSTAAHPLDSEGGLRLPSRMRRGRPRGVFAAGLRHLTLMLAVRKHLGIRINRRGQTCNAEHGILSRGKRIPPPRPGLPARGGCRSASAGTYALDCLRFPRCCLWLHVLARFPFNAASGSPGPAQRRAHTGCRNGRRSSTRTSPAFRSDDAAASAGTRASQRPENAGST